MRMRYWLTPVVVLATSSTLVVAGPFHSGPASIAVAKADVASVSSKGPVRWQRLRTGWKVSPSPSPSPTTDPTTITSTTPTTNPTSAPSPTSTATPTPVAPSPTPTSSVPPAPLVLFDEPFDGADGLVTNEYAYWNPTHSDAIVSPNWEMTSGSLFSSGGKGWTGTPDGGSPNATSTTATGSAVFRLNTRRYDYGNVAVQFDLLNNRLVSTSRTPAVDWDGVHIWLRYQSQYSLYYASVNRRDGRIVIKKKVPGGPSNDGTYYELCSEIPNHPIPFGSWQHVGATVRNNSDGSVTINLLLNGSVAATATDRGVGGPPITAAGAVGIRGDNDDFLFDNFIVSPL